jgi:CitMHS family citrate-Mg2+:H+ or citrate-Ca2+:H+ symporter
MDMLAVIGFVMVFALVFCLVTKKLLPPVAFIILPILAALAAGFGATEIGKFATDGVKGMVSTVSLFVFSISFFSLMSDVGVFDAIVGKLMKVAGNNVTAVMLATAAIATIIHLDGAGAATFLITITAMAPVFKRMKLDKRILMLIVCVAIGVMNVLPWAGPTIRAATVLKMEDSADLWRPLIPIQALNVGVVFVMTYLLCRIQKRRLLAHGGMDSFSRWDDDDGGKGDPKNGERLIDTSRHGLMLFNYLLTIGVITTLVLNLLPAAFTFMIGLSVGLVVNIRELSAQSRQLKKYGMAAMAMVVTLFAAGVFTGLLSKTGMLDRMALSIVGVIPNSIGQYTHFIVGLLSVPLIMCLGTDAFYFGLLPVVINVSANFGVEPIHVARILLVAENIGVMVSPMTPALYIGLGLVNLDIGDHIRHSLPWIWTFSVLSIIFSVILGLVPLP